MLDGEIVCLDAQGRPQFYELMRRRGSLAFAALDALGIGAQDFRGKPLPEGFTSHLRSILHQEQLLRQRG